MNKTKLKIKNSLLMGPGPCNVHPRVLNAMSQQTIGHLDAQFAQISKEINYILQHIFQTKNELTLAISGPGSAGMETCMVNLLEPGDEVLICINGVFGNRLSDMAERCKAKVIRVEVPMGEIITPEHIEQALKTCQPKLIAIVHAETSSGVLQPLAAIGKIAKEANVLFVVDAVASFSGIEIKMDDWHIDAIYAATQKCLGAPPGMSPISFSQKAIDVIIKRKTKVQSWLLDVLILKDLMDAGKRSHAYTSPVSNTYALYEALLMVKEEGLENRYKRHQEMHILLEDSLKKMGFEFIVKPAHRLPFVNVIKIPKGIDDITFRKELKQSYGIEIAGGLGKYIGKVWRIGLMGEGCSENSIQLLLNAMQSILKKKVVY